LSANDGACAFCHGTNIDPDYELRSDILAILETLRGHTDPSQRWCELERCIPMSRQEERDLFGRYDAAVKQVQNAFGEPNYNGIGKRRGYEGPSPASTFIYYKNAVQIAWWEKDNWVFTVVATGHDADSLYTLCLVVIDSGSDN
jgi:hypothetical protein